LAVITSGVTLRFLANISLLLMICICASSAQEVPPGVKIAHFERVDAGVFAGSKPHTEADFEFLQSLGVRYIVSTRFLPLLSGSEKRHARRYGMTLLSMPMNASPIPPRQKHVDQILQTLRKDQPVYVHCVLGRDRTGLIAGLYRIRYLGVSKDEAWEQMKESGFHTWWFTRGLNVYFKKHSGVRR
jgi:protein-tyrosine phosphatase